MDPKERAEMRGDLAREALAHTLAELRRREEELVYLTKKAAPKLELAMIGVGVTAMAVAAFATWRARRRPRTFSARIAGVRLFGART